MNFKALCIVAALVFTSLGTARAANLIGSWTAQFDTQIGMQKYVYEFKADGEKLTGKATFERSLGNGSVELKEITLKGDDVFFVESLHVNDMDLRITYTGKIAGDEITFTRQVGDFATERFVAKRMKPADKPAPAPAKS